MPPENAKRFYKRAETQQLNDVYGVALDGRAVRTPAGGDLRISSRRLAEAIAAEWQAQEEKINPASMPMMQLACTAIDRVMPNRAEIIVQTAAYGASDLLCYRADGPDELVARQNATWQPVLDWAANELSAPLVLAGGIMHIEQPDASLNALRSAIEGLDDWHLTGATQLTQVLGSLVLALTVVRGHLEWRQAFEASVLDEIFQADRWGEDREALQRRNAQADEVRAAAAFLNLL
jgi:chaperone required for assembly of F1-ATPase